MRNQAFTYMTVLISYTLKAVGDRPLMDFALFGLNSHPKASFEIKTLNDLRKAVRAMD